MPAKAYSYLRFSTPEQQRGDSFRRQTELAKRYAASHGLELDEKLTFRDLGKSAFRGQNVETGQLGAFLEAVREGIVEQGSYLLVESLDRVSRKQARKAVRVLEDIVESGVTVVTLSDGKAYTEESLDGFDFLMAVMILIRAHEESLMKSRRLKASWDAKRSKASERPLTSVSPGWIEVKDGEARLIKERAKVIRRIFREYLKGYGKESIARRLNADNVSTFGRSTMWRRSYIDKVLNNCACVGTFVPHETQYTDGKTVRVPLEPVPDYFPAVVDAETFERARSLMQSKGRQRGRHSGKQVKSVVAGLASCPLCGSTMTRVMKGSGSKAGKPYLVCTNAKAGKGCDYRSVTLDRVERALTYDPGSIIADMPVTDDGLADEIANHEGQLMALQVSIDRLLDELERGPSQTVSKRLRQTEDQYMAAQEELDELRRRAAQEESKLVSHKAGQLLEALRTDPLDIQAANVALRQCLTRIVVDYRSGFLELHWQQGGISSVPFTMESVAGKKVGDERGKYRSVKRTSATSE